MTPQPWRVRVLRRPDRMTGRTRLLGIGLTIAGAVGAAGVAIAMIGPPSRAAQAGPVSAFPAPGTQTALRGTRISLRGVTPSAAGVVTVTGSRSGEHRGTLLPHPDGRGVSFVPESIFRDGERVTVRTSLEVRGARDGDWRFTVARGDFRRPTRTSERRVPRPRKGSYHAYHSTALKTPRLDVTTRRSGRGPGSLVVNTGWSDERPRPDGILIADDRGQPLYFRPREPGAKVFNVAVQRYRGQPVLTYWEGSFAAGWGYGEYVVLDQSYREIARIRAVGGNRADIHEMRITPAGTALVLSYNGVRHGGGDTLDNVIQEIDLASGRLLFEWHSIGHIALRESYDRRERGKPFDYLHLNSIDIGPGGDLLLSARNTCALYEIDRTTGAINWRLGGKRSDFRMGRSSRFCRQHDARWAGAGTITLFDNHIDRAREGGQSRGLKLGVDERRRRVRLLRGYKHSPPLKAPNKGSARMLANGNLLVGWGAEPVITEFTRTGRVVFDARFRAADDGAYRVTRADWSGRPPTPPSLAAQRRGSRIAAWASWNGATEVARWQVLGGATPEALAPVGGRARTGFETAISVPAGSRYIAVRALDARGTVLGESSPIQPD